MQAARSLVHLQPDPTPVDAELRYRPGSIVDDDGTLRDIAANGMYAGSENQVGLLAIRKPQS